MRQRTTSFNNAGRINRNSLVRPTGYWSAFLYQPSLLGAMIMLRRMLCGVILTLLVCSVARSQWPTDSAVASHVHRGIDFVYNMSFDSAKAEFRLVRKAVPDHPAGYFLLAMAEWWQIVVDPDDVSHDETFLTLLDQVMASCDKRLDANDEDITGLFFKGGALGFRGRLYAYREDWVKAANDGRNALPIVQQAYKLAPDNYDVLLGIGIYNYYADVIPQQYPIVKPLMIFFPKGDKDKGIMQLQRASEKAAYANTEAAYFLLQLLYSYEKQYLDALPWAVRLTRQYPGNALFQKYEGRCYAAVGNWGEMHETFTDIQHRVEQKKPGYNALTERESQFYLGLYDMHYKSYKSALDHFYRSDELSRSLDKHGASAFMVMTNLKIGMVYDLQSKRDQAKEQYQKVLRMNDFQDAHKQAEQFLKSPCESD